MNYDESLDHFVNHYLNPPCLNPRSCSECEAVFEENELLDEGLLTSRYLPIYDYLIGLEQKKSARLFLCVDCHQSIVEILTEKGIL